MATVAEREEGVMIHWQSTDGFPCGAVVAFERGPPNNAGSGGSSTTVTLEFYCHPPYELAKKEGVMVVSLDIEERIAECLQTFAGVAAATQSAGGLEALAAKNAKADGSSGDEMTISAGTLPTGTGLTGMDGTEIGRGGDTKVSRAAMERAAKEFEARVGRKPFTVELIKQLYKK